MPQLRQDLSILPLLAERPQFVPEPFDLGVREVFVDGLPVIVILVVVGRPQLLCQFEVVFFDQEPAVLHGVLQLLHACFDLALRRVQLAHFSGELLGQPLVSFCHLFVTTGPPRVRLLTGKMLGQIGLQFGCHAPKPASVFLVPIPKVPEIAPYFPWFEKVRGAGSVCKNGNRFFYERLRPVQILDRPEKESLLPGHPLFHGIGRRRLRCRLRSRRSCRRSDQQERPHERDDPVCPFIGHSHAASLPSQEYRLNPSPRRRALRSQPPHPLRPQNGLVSLPDELPDRLYRFIAFRRHPDPHGQIV